MPGTEPHRNESGQFASATDQMVAERRTPGDLEAGNPALKAAMDKWRDRLKADAAANPDTLLLEPSMDSEASTPVVAPNPVVEVQVDKAAHAAALAAAKRLKIPAKAIESMTPAELVEAGKDWEAQISANGALSREIGELREKVKASSVSKEAAPVQTAQPADDLDSVLQPFVAKLEVDEETGKTLGEMLKAVDARWASRVQTLESQLGEFAQDRTMRVVQESRDRLRERFPQLGDDAVFEGQVLPHVVKLVKGGYTLPEAISHAAAIEFPTAAPSQVSHETKSSKRNGVAVTDTGKTRVSQSKDPDAKLRETYYRLCKQDGLIP